jgi:hypothetical protein
MRVEVLFMKRSSWIILPLALLSVVAGVVLVGAMNRPVPAPEVLIAQSLEDAERAAARGSISGIMESISDTFQSGGMNKTRLRLLLTRTQNNTHGTDYDVHVNAPKILPARADKPDERVVMSRFSVFAPSDGTSYWGTDGVTLVMHKEWRTKWLFVSEPCWRIVSIANLPPIMGEDIGN